MDCTFVDHEYRKNGDVSESIMQGEDMSADDDFDEQMMEEEDMASGSGGNTGGGCGTCLLWTLLLSAGIVGLIAGIGRLIA